MQIKRVKCLFLPWQSIWQELEEIIPRVTESVEKWILPYNSDRRAHKHIFLEWIWQYVLFKFIYFEKEREREWGKGQREREPKQAPHCQHQAQGRAQTQELWDHDLSWNRVGGLTDWATQAPRQYVCFFLNLLKCVCLLTKQVHSYEFKFILKKSSHKWVRLCAQE